MSDIEQSHGEINGEDTIVFESGSGGAESYRRNRPNNLSDFPPPSERGSAPTKRASILGDLPPKCATIGESLL
jgi:hypothetical protein